MSKPLILLTIGLPYLIGWALALLAVYNLHLYRRQVKGVIYKDSLFQLEIGLTVVVVFYIIVELFIAFSTYIASAKLSSLLLFIYLLLAFYGAGFLMIASGANKLSKIEKVK